MGKIQRIQELYKEGGVRNVSIGIYEYLRDECLKSQSDVYCETRADNEQRWEFIWPYIADADTLLDIGCAEGYFSVKSAECGLSATGIDIDEERVRRAKKIIVDKEELEGQCEFYTRKLSPKNIHGIPEVDVILSLTVHHHWEGDYGLDDAEKMFQILLDRCDTLIYEPPGDRPLVKDQYGTLDPVESAAFYTDRLKALYGDEIEILDQTMVGYKGENELPTYSYRDQPRNDPIFVIDTSSFQL